MNRRRSLRVMLPAQPQTRPTPMSRQNHSIVMRRIVNSIPAGEYSVSLVQVPYYRPAVAILHRDRKEQYLS